MTCSKLHLKPYNVLPFACSNYYNLFTSSFYEKTSDAKKLFGANRNLSKSRAKDK